MCRNMSSPRFSLFRSDLTREFEFIAETSSTPSPPFSSTDPSRVGTSNLSSFSSSHRLNPPHRFGRRGGVPPAQRFVLPAPPSFAGSAKVAVRRRRARRRTFFLEAFVGDEGGLRTAFFDRLRGGGVLRGYRAYTAASMTPPSGDGDMGKNKSGGKS